MKREKRLTKKERKALSPAAAAGLQGSDPQATHGHIHCIACGKHLDAEMFGEPGGAAFMRCDHGADFPHCVACQDKARALVQEHDRNGTPVKKAAAWH
jgi:hypothetical protein